MYALPNAHYKFDYITRTSIYIVTNSFITKSPVKQTIFWRPAKVTVKCMEQKANIKKPSIMKSPL